MSDTLQLALVAVLAASLSAIITAIVNGFKDRRDATIKKEEREADWKRQDQVAERAALAAEAVKRVAERQELATIEVKRVATQASEAAALLVSATAETNRRTEEVAKVAAEADIRTQTMLGTIDESTKQIHRFVNADFTASLRNGRDTTMLLILALKKLRAGQGSSPEEDALIAAKEASVRELDKMLADRATAQQALADAETKLHAAEGGRRIGDDPSVSQTLKNIETNTAENTTATQAVADALRKP